MPSSYYDSFCNAFYREPLRLSEESILEYLRRVFEFHASETPYWRNALKNIDLDEIFQGSLKEVFEKIFNSGLAVDEEYLRNNWLDFLPQNYGGRIRFYQSSGTTRERAIGHWDRDYLFVLLKYLRTALDKLYGLNETFNEDSPMRALAHGPYGWFQEEISELVWSYGGALYFIGMETDGLKKVYEREGMEALLRMLQPLVKYTHRVLKADRINMVRTAPPLMNLFEESSESIEVAMVSGVGIDHNFYEYFSEKFEGAKLIPLYGYYLFGDIVGMRKGKSFWYYPNYPFTVMFPLKTSEREWRIVKRKERGRLGLIIARPEVLVIKVENEDVLRVPPQGPFTWDGIGDPRR